MTPKQVRGNSREKILWNLGETEHELNCSQFLLRTSADPTHPTAVSLVVQGSLIHQFAAAKVQASKSEELPCAQVVKKRNRIRGAFTRVYLMVSRGNVHLWLITSLNPFTIPSVRSSRCSYFAQVHCSSETSSTPSSKNPKPHENLQTSTVNHCIWPKCLHLGRMLTLHKILVFLCKCWAS